MYFKTAVQSDHASAYNEIPELGFQTVVILDLVYGYPFMLWQSF